MSMSCAVGATRPRPKYLEGHEKSLSSESTIFANRSSDSRAAPIQFSHPLALGHPAVLRYCSVVFLGGAFLTHWLVKETKGEVKAKGDS
jgi:hypothetical protein